VRLDGEAKGHRGPESAYPQDGCAIVKVEPWLILLFSSIIGEKALYTCISILDVKKLLQNLVPRNTFIFSTLTVAATTFIAY
jgi:hypothetical protein